MASRTPSSDVLEAILETLHRLETRFEESLSDAGSSPISRMGSVSSHRPSMMAQRPRQFPSLYHNELPVEGFQASTYMRSIMEMRKRFEFDSSSELATEDGEDPQKTQETTMNTDVENDAYTMSVYSSRPLSRLELDIPPVPSFRQEEAVIQEARACRIHHYRSSDLLKETPRYEHIPASAGSSSNASYKRSLSDSQHSASTAPTSIISSIAEIKRKVDRSETISRTYSGCKRSLKRLVSPQRKEGDTLVTQAQQPMEDGGHEFGEDVHQATTMLAAVQKKTRQFVSAIPKFCSMLSRRLVEQQLKMLEVRD